MFNEFQRDLDKIQEVVKKQEKRNEWIETMVKQLEEQVACIEGNVLYLSLHLGVWLNV